MSTPPRRYQVLDLVETAEPTDDGRLQRITLIRYRLANGHIFELRIAEVGLTPESVQTLLEGEVAAKERIFALGS